MYKQVRTLGETVRLDARTKLLNPKWYEGMLGSGYEGVREIQKRLTNTMGWSATSGMVSTCMLVLSGNVFERGGHVGVSASPLSVVSGNVFKHGGRVGVSAYFSLCSLAY
jgi:hypothetical protein